MLILVIYVYIGRVLCVKRVCLFVSSVLLCVFVYSWFTAHPLSLWRTYGPKQCMYICTCSMYICTYCMWAGKRKILQHLFYFCNTPSPRRGPLSLLSSRYRRLLAKDWQHAARQWNFLFWIQASCLQVWCPQTSSQVNCVSQLEGRFSLNSFLI